MVKFYLFIVLLCLCIACIEKVEFLVQKIEKHAAILHSLDNRSSKGHVYYAEDRLAIALLAMLLRLVL